MTDVVDRASELENQQRQHALSATRLKERPLIISGTRCCLRCEQPIAELRVKSVNAVRCIECQQIVEVHQKHYRK